MFGRLAVIADKMLWARVGVVVVVVADSGCRGFGICFVFLNQLLLPARRLLARPAAAAVAAAVDATAGVACSKLWPIHRRPSNRDRECS